MKGWQIILIFVGGVVAVSVVLWGLFLLVGPEPSASRQSQSDEDQLRDAWFECKIAVLDRLKNPNGADFPWRSDIRASRGYDGTITIRSYVDATNSFGAVVRTPFVCEAKKVGITYIATVDILE